MSLREKIKLNLPLYLVLSVIFSVSIWSLWLPNWLGKTDDAEAAQVSYGTATNIATMVPRDTQTRLLYVPTRSEYALLFTSSTVDTASPTSTCGVVTNGDDLCSIYFTTSSNGLSWSRPRVVTTTARFNGKTVLGGFTFDTVNQSYLVTFTAGNDGRTVKLAYTQNYGLTWGYDTPVSTLDSRTESVLATATSTDLVAYLGVNRTQGLYIATTTLQGGGAVNPSTILPSGNYIDINSGDPLIIPIGLSISRANGTTVLHAVYASATNTALGYRISYASSTNLGVTWASTTISTVMAVDSTDLACFECNLNTSATDVDGLLQIMYYQATSYDTSGMGSGTIIANTRIVHGQMTAGGIWTTTTLRTAVPITVTTTAGGNDFSATASGLVAPVPNRAIGFYVATSSVGYGAFNTSSSFIIDDFNAEYIQSRGGIATAYVTSSQTLAVAYTSGNRIRFVTSSVKIASLNSMATTTAISPYMDQSGLVGVSTTLSDSNRENVTLYVDYSLDGGTTWASSTLNAATGATDGTLTTSTGKITGITTVSSQLVTFYWNMLADAGTTSTSNVKIRILADDGISTSGYRQSAAFLGDTLPPGIPSTLTLTPSTSTIALSWTASTGTPSLYLVSSTAMSVSTTVDTVVTSTSLSPNTQYSFQVKAQDSYNNTSSFSNVTSTYTNPDVPTSVSASAAGSTSITVTWSANSNGTGTVYEVYNVTTAAVVDTTTDTSYTVTGLTASTEYQFKVRAQYLSNSSSYSDYSDNSTAVSTSAASSSGSSGGGAVPAAPPATPAAQPVVAPAVATMELEPKKPVVKKVGASEHTYTVLSANGQTAELRIQSEPITVSLAVGIPQEVDTDRDGIKDLKVTYTGLVQNKIKITVANLTDENELKNALTIQAGAYETNNRQVMIRFGLENITQVALSNTPDFSASSFTSFEKQKTWRLSPGDGVKTVYARLRNAQGGMVSVSDTIVLKETAVSVPVTPPVTQVPEEVKPSGPQFKRVLKRGLTGADVVLVQNELKKLNYFPKSIVANGVYGPTTEVSVKAFEKATAQKVDGIVDQATWNVLFKTVAQIVDPAPTGSVPAVQPAQKPNLSRGASGDNVLWVQQKLMTLGFFPKNIVANGYFGPATQAAVKAFQKAKGISQTGTVGPLTWNALSK